MLPGFEGGVRQGPQTCARPVRNPAVPRRIELNPLRADESLKASLKGRCKTAKRDGAYMARMLVKQVASCACRALSLNGRTPLSVGMGALRCSGPGRPWRGGYAADR